MSSELVKPTSAVEQRTNVDRILENRNPDIREQQPHGRESIAIVGMSARFPRCTTVDEYWNRVLAGDSLLSEPTDDELRNAGIELDSSGVTHFVRSGTRLEDAESFDAKFFEMSKREAEMMDPQQRIFLECAYEALEHAGIPGDGENVGVFAGTGMNTYMLQLLANPEMLASAGGYQLMLGNDKDFLATRVAYKLNLKGPAVGIQTACSTSLAAVHLACQSLLLGECDSALAGGVSVSFPQIAGYEYIPGMILSPDGICRPFDEQAHGTIPGKGVGVVVLKRERDAIVDGDKIYAVIAGSAWNNDGADKAGYTAPSVEGQVKVIRAAHAAAGVAADQISYVEAHGTGTELGDPIEVAALTEAFGTRQSDAPRCVLGSVKANMGHTDVAAGVAGLIKATQAIYHGVIPGTPNFLNPNPALEIERTPFVISNKAEPWPENETEHWAGVSSFGIGGTNVHLVLRSAKTVPQAEDQALLAQGPWVFNLSAKTENALVSSITRLADFLEKNADQPLVEVAATLQTGRRAYGFRYATVADNREELLSNLRKPLKAGTSQVEAGSIGAKVAFLFPGQGQQFAGMAVGLYRSHAKFRALVARGLAVLPGVVSDEILKFAFLPSLENGDSIPRLSTAVVQPLLLIVEYALTMLWIELGIKPNVLIGHSLGELTAATVAGVFSFEDGVRLAAERGRLMQDTPAGTMLAVSLSVEKVASFLTSELWIAAENAPNLTVISGSEAAVQQLVERLAPARIASVRLTNDRAFHTPLMAEASTLFRDVVASVERSKPHLPWLSNVTGGWITADEATSAQYWSDHITSRVRFVENAEILSQRGCFLLEAGPGDSLITLVRQLGFTATRRLQASTLGRENKKGDDYRAFLEAISKVWSQGANLNWRALSPHQTGLPLVYSSQESPVQPGSTRVDAACRRVALPTYPFERERYWVEATHPNRPASETPEFATDPIHSAGRDLFAKRDDLSSWLYVPSWQRTPSAALLFPAQTRIATWLVLKDDHGFGALIADRLERSGFRVHSISSELADRSLLDKFWSEQREITSSNPIGLVNCWTMLGTAAGNRDVHVNGIDPYEGLLLVLQSAQAARVRFAQVEVILDELIEINDESVEEPGRATAEGLARILSAEFAGVRGRIIDPGHVAGDQSLPAASKQLTAAVNSVCDEIGYVAPTCLTVAFRSGHRWQQIWQNVPLSSPAISAFREGGVYLITGGLGGVSFLVAQYLLRRFNVKVALVGRSQLPPRDQWEEWLTEHRPSDPTSRRIQRAKELSSAGGEYKLFIADVADRDAMQNTLTAIESQFGTVTAVIHAAGLPGGTRVASQSMDTVRETFQSKVQGSQVLAELFTGRSLDFLLFCSSISAILSLAGAADYAAANAFQDRYALWCKQKLGLRTISVNFDAWREVGMIAELEASSDFQYVIDDRLRTAMTSEEGLEILERALASGETQVTVSTMDLHEVIKSTSRGWADASVEEHSAALSNEDFRANQDRETGGESDLSAATLAVIDIWQELLGAESVNPSDNFFELGGHSLLGTMVLARIRERFGVELTIRAIFEAPTPRLLGIRIQEANRITEAVGVSGDREEFTF